MSKQDPIHVIAILWGTQYAATDANRLLSMIRRNASQPIHFHLFTNETLADLSSDIDVHPEPVLHVDPAFKRYNYRKEVGLCDDNLAGLMGKRVFFFDLDVLIMDKLDELFAYPQGDGFYIIKDWNTRGNHVGQATCYSFVVGTLGFVKKAFEANPQAVLKAYGTASQEYLSAQVIERLGPLNFWPTHWFRSFRYHCLPWGPLRHIITPKKPKEGTKVLAFHGCPGLRDAIAGQWSEPTHFKPAKGWKKIYKTCRPTPWVKQIWHDPTHTKKMTAHAPAQNTTHYRAYIINLNAATDRWETIRRSLEPLGIPHIRINAVDGHKQPATPAEYNRLRYNITHGKSTSPGETGCYRSHIKALQEFLQSGDTYGLILEDDVELPETIVDLIAAALEHSKHWDLLRLSAHTPGKPLAIADLPHGHVLAYNLKVLKNTGAYLINRTAAQLVCEKMIPMYLPYDVALDYEWRYGFKTAYISPLPVLIDYDLPSQIKVGRKLRFFRTTTFKWFHGVRNVERRIHRRRYFREAAAPQNDS